MAEALVSGILKQLFSMAYGEMDARLRLVVGVDEAIEKLISNYQAIRAVLEDAEKRQVKDLSVRDWMDKLKDTSYDIEDVLDEWNTAIKKLQIENASKPLVLRKVCSPILSCCSRHDIATKITDLNRKLDLIVMEKNIFNFSSMSSVGECLDREITTSIIDVSKIHGRDHDMNEVVNLLLSESSEATTIPIISIVGMGGIGKTTLARQAFSDDKVKTHFDTKVWVCVSDPFEEIRVAKAILESLGSTDVSKLVELETVLQHISRSIERKRFLLVLDDVWTEEAKKWEQLMGSLKCGSNGSRILVTTRKKRVADVLETTKIISLETLSEEESWSFFSQVALLGRRTSEECQQLECIGREIVRKCKGLPLAIKTLGSLLCFKRRIEEWQIVLDNEMWKLEEIEKGLFPPLLLSYYDLPSILRKCFSYCAIFPKDYVIKKDELIKLWMAQGYLNLEGREDKELVGEQYLENLAMRSLFQDFVNNEYDGGIKSCKMHDIVHDTAQFLTKNECLSIEVDGSKEYRLEAFSYRRTRHLMIMLDHKATIPISIYEEKKLRSLVVRRRDTFLGPDDVSKLFDRLTCLRTLELNSSLLNSSIPSSIRKLMHLRYLNLSRNDRVRELPETLCELYNLEILDISNCVGLERLPKGMAKLVNLMHLINSGCPIIWYMPKGIGRLTCLKTLNEVEVGGVGNGFTLGCLKDLNHLHGLLRINWLGITEVGEAEKALVKKENINHLSLLFNDDRWNLSFPGRMRLNLYKLTRRARKRNDEEVLEALQPPSNLKKLEILYHSGSSVSPSWLMSLTNLRGLRITVCENCERLPPLGKLPSLESLQVSWMGSVKRVGDGFLGMESEEGDNSSSSMIAFPKLKSLMFTDMAGLEEWDYGITRTRGEGDITIMPSLRSLVIRFCPKLKALPDHLLQMVEHHKLESCRIDHCDSLNISQRRYVTSP